MSINKYQKLFEDETGYKEIPFPVRVELLGFLLDFRYDATDEPDSPEALVYYRANVAAEYVDYPEYSRLANFDLEETEIYQLAQQIMPGGPEKLWEYFKERWNMDVNNYQIYANALKKFENAYGKNANPLKHMDLDEFLDAFGDKQ